MEFQWLEEHQTKYTGFLEEKFFSKLKNHAIINISKILEIHFRKIRWFWLIPSRGVWILLFLGCLVMLYLNAISVLDKYHRNEKIVDIQLKFGELP